MPIEKSKPTSSAKTAPSKPKAKSSELGDDDLRRISGGMAGGGGSGTTPPVCVSQT
jgi:hypothetical protein